MVVVGRTSVGGRPVVSEWVSAIAAASCRRGRNNSMGRRPITSRGTMSVLRTEFAFKLLPMSAMVSRFEGPRSSRSGRRSRRKKNKTGTKPRRLGGVCSKRHVARLDREHPCTAHGSCAHDPGAFPNLNLRLACMMLAIVVRHVGHACACIRVSKVYRCSPRWACSCCLFRRGLQPLLAVGLGHQGGCGARIAPTVHISMPGCPRLLTCAG